MPSEHRASIEQLTAFFSAQRAVAAEHYAGRLTQEKAAFRAFQKRQKEAAAQWAELRQQTAPGFNVFRVLRLQRKEEGLHTPWLRHLLNPGGSHGQGPLLLDAFLAQVLGSAHRHAHMQHYHIAAEVHAGPYGRLDLLLRYTLRPGGERYAVVIENKIDAGDQPHQLWRYRQYLRGYDEAHLTVVYLTPQGQAPSGASLAAWPNHGPALAREQVTQIGYHQHLVPWLQCCIRETKAPAVQVLLRQYLDVVRRL